MRMVRMDTTVSEEGRCRDKEEQITREAVQVRSIDADIILCPFGGSNCKGLEVVPTR